MNKTCIHDINKYFKKNICFYSPSYIVWEFSSPVYLQWELLRYAENDSLVLWYAHNYLTSKMMAIIRI